MGRKLPGRRQVSRLGAGLVQGHYTVLPNSICIWKIFLPNVFSKARPSVEVVTLSNTLATHTYLSHCPQPVTDTQSPFQLSMLLQSCTLFKCKDSVSLVHLMNVCRMTTQKTVSYTIGTY